VRRLLAFALLLAQSPGFADLSEEVRCREIGFSLAAERHDWEAFASFVDEDARFISEAVLRGRSAVVEAWSGHFAEGGPSIRWRPQLVEVLQGGELALTRGPYRVVTKDAEGQVNESWGTFNSVWRLNSDGHWRVVFDAGSQAQGPPDAAVAAVLDEQHACEAQPVRGD
jgi:ketosteroid isomerase-like protein